MSEEPKERSSFFTAAFLIMVIGGSAFGALYWHLGNRRGLALDTSGFDIANGSEDGGAPATFAAPGVPSPAAAGSGLGMITAAPGVKAGMLARPGAPAPPRAAPAVADAGADKEKAAAIFKQKTLKHEDDVRQFGKRMESQYPSLKEYAKDWNKAPELRALKDQYWKDRDPIKFIYGLMKSENFPALVKKYAGDPGIQAFIAEGVKSAPGELLSAAGNVFRTDPAVNELVGTVGKGLGLGKMLGAMAPADAVKAAQEAEAAAAATR